MGGKNPGTGIEIQLLVEYIKQNRSDKSGTTTKQHFIASIPQKELTCKRIGL